jgi:hypothetical protein
VGSEMCIRDSAKAASCDLWGMSTLPTDAGLGNGAIFVRAVVTEIFSLPCG